MNRIAALIITATAISAAPHGYADVYDQTKDQNDAFTWTDIDDSTPTARSVKDPIRDSGNPSFGKKTPNPKVTAPQNPVVRKYPAKDTPKNHVPEAGVGERHFTDECDLHQKQSPQSARSGGTGRSIKDPTLRRRGEMTGDDGILEAIQDDPCAVIHRRGGPSSKSVNEYTHPDDIRRANSLEDRRIPIHQVGRYAPEGSSLWYRDPNNPYIDSKREWHVEKGLMLSHMITDWGEEAGFNVVWRSPHDFVVQTDVVLNGTFPEAAGEVIESFKNANPPISGDFYISNRVLVVESGSEFDGR